MKGLGHDIIEIERIRKSIVAFGHRFMMRLFTQKEQEYCLKNKDPAPSFAGRFAAKEAIAKALGTGFGEHLSWHDIEILPDSFGKPCVTLSPSIQQAFNNPQILLTITHNNTLASAVAIWL